MAQEVRVVGGQYSINRKKQKMPMRYITIKLILTNGDTYKESPDGSSNVKILTCNSEYGHCNANITIIKTGMGFSGDSATIVIHGLDITSIEQFQYMQQYSPVDLGINAVEIYAGDRLVDGKLPQFMYRGEVFLAKLPANPASNDIGFVIKSLNGVTSMNQYTQDTSIKGTVSHDSVLRSIISRAEFPYNYLPHKVNGFVTDIHLKGNWRKQLSKFCESFGYNFRIDANNVYVSAVDTTLTNVGRATTISANNIMQGNPEGEDRSVFVNTWYDSNLVFGQQVKLDTYLTYLAGDYTIVGMKINIANNDDCWDNQLELARY